MLSLLASRNEFVETTLEAPLDSSNTSCLQKTSAEELTVQSIWEYTSAEFKSSFGNCPQHFWIKVYIYHSVSPLHPHKASNPKYGQLYT
jgi:hypothetical protein